MNIPKTDLETLEHMVDSSSLSDVLAELAAICFDKSEHVRMHWQDPDTARAWARAGNKLTAFLAKIEV